MGSGKSYVAKMINEKYHAELLIADEMAHSVVEKGTEGLAQLRELLGEEIIKEDGSLDRGQMAQIMFGNKEITCQVNNIIHPRVLSAIEEYISHRKDEEGLIILESALMYESGCHNFCDEVWYIHVPVETRIERLMENRGYTREKSKSIIASQLGDDFLFSHADRVIENGSTFSELEVQVDREIGRILSK